MTNGKIGVTTENIFPVIKKFLYSDHEIFLARIGVERSRRHAETSKHWLRAAKCRVNWAT